VVKSPQSFLFCPGHAGTVAGTIIGQYNTFWGRFAQPGAQPSHSRGRIATHRLGFMLHRRIEFLAACALTVARQFQGQHHTPCKSRRILPCPDGVPPIQAVQPNCAPAQVCLPIGAELAALSSASLPAFGKGIRFDVCKLSFSRSHLAGKFRLLPKCEHGIFPI
jgi:hypothetical protein